MLTYEEIRAIAEQYVTAHYPFAIGIQAETPIKEPAGWYFSLNAENRCPGFGAIFVDSQTGEILLLDSAMLAYQGARSAPQRLSQGQLSADNPGHR